MSDPARSRAIGFYGTTPPRLIVIPGLQDRGPDEEAAGNKRQNGSCHLEVPRVRQMVVEGIRAPEPEVFALQAEGVVGEDHHRHHDEHP